MRIWLTRYLPIVAAVIANRPSATTVSSSEMPRCAARRRRGAGRSVVLIDLTGRPDGDHAPRAELIVPQTLVVRRVRGHHHAARVELGGVRPSPANHGRGERDVL